MWTTWWCHIFLFEMKIEEITIIVKAEVHKSSVIFNLLKIDSVGICTKWQKVIMHAKVQLTYKTLFLSISILVTIIFLSNIVTHLNRIKTKMFTVTNGYWLPVVSITNSYYFLYITPVVIFDKKPLLNSTVVHWL